MITLACHLLLRDNKKDRFLVCFNDPARGLSLDTPCYLPAYACRFHPVDPETGEILDDHPTVLGDGLLTLPDRIESELPQYVAAVLEANRRNAAADQADAERRAKASAAAQRRNHDRQIAAQRRKKQAGRA